MTVVYFNRETKEAFACDLEAESWLKAAVFDSGKRNATDFERSAVQGFVQVRPTDHSLAVTTFDNPSVF